MNKKIRWIAIFFSSSLQTETPKNVFNTKALEDPETCVPTATNHHSCLHEENVQSSLSHLTTGTTTLSSCQLSLTKRTPLVSVPSSQKPGLNNSENKEISPVDFGSKFDDQSIVEKPKLTGFLQSLLKTQRKEKTEGFQSTLSTSISSQHESNKTILFGDGMDETTVLDSTIWTKEKDENSINHLHQANVSVEKIEDEKNCEMTQVFHRGGAMEETKVFSCRIWTEEEVYAEENEKTQILNKDGNMEETKVLTGGIWTGLERNSWMTDSKNPMGNFRQVEEETKTFGKDDDMEETKALTGEISIAGTTSLEKTKIDEWLENTNAQTASIVLENSTLKDKKDVEIKGEQMEKTKIFIQEDADKKEKEEENKMFSKMWNENTSFLKEKVIELKESDPDGEDSEVTFKIKKLQKENEMEKTMIDELMETEKENEAAVKAEGFVELQGSDPLVDSTDRETESGRQGEEIICDKDDENTRTLADMRNLLKKPTSKFDGILLRPKERPLKVNHENVTSSQMHKEVPCKNEGNKTLMFSNQSVLLDETKLVTAMIETVSKQKTSENESMQENKITENKTILFGDQSAMMEETETVPTELAQENDVLAYVGAQTKTNSGTVDQLPTITGNNIRTFFENDKGIMDEMKMITTSVDSMKTCSEGEDILPSVDLFKLTENTMQNGKFIVDVTGVQTTDEKSPGMYIRLFIFLSYSFYFIDLM